MSPDDQAKALASWGRGGSFKCIGCGREATDNPPPLNVPTPLNFPAFGHGISLGGCTACAKRWRQSAGFRRDVTAKAKKQIIRTLLQRAADLVGVSGSDFVEAMRQMNEQHPPGSEAFKLVDMALNVPAGSVEGAMLSVFGVQGMPQ